MSVFGTGTSLQVSAIKKHVSDYQLTPVVSMEGYVPDWRKRSTEFDFLVTPSLSEGMPNAVVEGFAEGLPAIASDIPAMAPLVKNGRNGFLFSPLDLASLVKLLEEVPIECAAWDAMSTASVASADRFSAKRMAQSYGVLYEEILGLKSIPSKPASGPAFVP